MNNIAIDYIKTLIWLYKELDDTSYLVEARHCTQRLIDRNNAHKNAFNVIPIKQSFDEETIELVA